MKISTLFLTMVCMVSMTCVVRGEKQELSYLQILQEKIDQIQEIQPNDLSELLAQNTTITLCNMTCECIKENEEDKTFACLNVVLMELLKNSPKSAALTMEQFDQLQQELQQARK